MARKVLAALALLAMVLGAFPSLPIRAQGPLPPRAPRGNEPAGVTPPSPQWSGSWQPGPNTPFTFTHLDGGYFPGDGRVYFMGGRLPNGLASGSIWSFNPANGSYADTSVDLLTAVSDYQMNLLQDGSGQQAFYLFCGRQSNGASSRAVQLYYPATHTVRKLGPEDDFPGAIACTAALNLVYAGKVYVAGGLDGANSSAETWVFDPLAPAGNRWTRLETANLSVARGYIAGAVVDGKLYAIGGSYDSAGSLLPVSRVEVLDPGAPQPTWDDGAVADLPEPCSESPTFSFSRASPFTDPDGTPLAGKIIAGCGAGSKVNGRVYAYDPALDLWSPFPALPGPRRAQAAEFWPGDGATQPPALWVWGGSEGPGAPALQSSAFYSLQSPSCRILLVDDDWDLGSSHGGGRPYYTSALDYLGRSYNLWDTVGHGIPTAGYMASYDVVIWFTGYDYMTPILPPEEAELTSYLDGGGSLLLSDLDQVYTGRPITPLFSDYFWVDSVITDVVITDAMGNAADPLFAGLGPYTMARPDLWDTYWPTQTQWVGPFDDEVHARPGGYEPMNYFTGGAPNSTRFEGAGFKTVYLAWPLEWLPRLEDRAAVMGTALNWLCPVPSPAGTLLLPAAQEGSGTAGTALRYPMTVVNHVGADDAFTITYASNWTVQGPGTVGPVVDGGYLSFMVTVTVPTDAGCLESDEVTITAQAWSDPTYSDTATVRASMPSGVGNVIITVRDANTMGGMPDAYVSLSSGDYAFSDWTGSNGRISFQDLPVCQFKGRAEKIGYENQFLSVEPAAGLTTTQEVTMTSGLALVSPSSVHLFVDPGMTWTYPVWVENTGSGPLRYYVSEVPSGSPAPPPPAPRPGERVDPRLYADLAASPQGTASLVVYMAEQADLSGAFAVRDRSARGRYVLERLRETATRTQSGLTSDLERAGVPYESYYIVNALVVQGDAALVQQLAARPDVAYVESGTSILAPAPRDRAPVLSQADSLSWNVQQVRAGEVWGDFGSTGQGVVVASIDTGVLYTHTALVGQYRGNEGGGAFDHNYNWWDPYGYAAAPYDYNGQGSQAMGVVLGSDDPAHPFSATNAIGVAPGARWFACQGFDRESNTASAAALLECAEFILAPWDLTGADANPDLRPDIVDSSLSMGEGGWWYNQAAYAWRVAGILAVFPAGDAGPACATATAPGDLPMVLSAGATDQADRLAPFSSRGPVPAGGLLKPDLSAPGVDILSAANDGSLQPFSGTVAAAAHAAGEVALLWAAQPELRGEVGLTIELVEHSAMGITTTDGCGGDTPPVIPNNSYGWGRIDAYTAVSTALSSNWDIPWLSVSPYSGTLPPGEATTLTLRLDTAGLITGSCYTGSLRFDWNQPGTAISRLPVELCAISCVPISGTGFTWSPLGPTIGWPVSFAGSVITGTAPDYRWSWGDGTPRQIGRSLDHAFATVGRYTVTVTASNYCSQDQVVRWVTVSGFCRPVTGTRLAALPPTPHPGEAVLFQGMAQGQEPLSFHWSMGDGAVAEGISTTHVYTLPGSYLVQLTATNGCSSGPRDLFTTTVHVVTGCLAPSGAAIEWRPARPDAGQDVAFHASLLTGTSPLTFTWKFGDGFAGAGYQVVHSYAATGTYTLILTITNPCGWTVEHRVLVVAPTWRAYLPLQFLVR